MEVIVSFKGQPITLTNFSPDDTIMDLKNILKEKTMIHQENQKLILKGRAVEGSTVLRDLLAKDNSGLKFLLVGSRTEEIAEVVTAKPTERVRNDLGPGKGAPRRAGQPRPLRPRGPPSPYRFGRIETLPDLPDQTKAREILETLANDPGILKVLEKHRWSVGALCELYPEGEVGISEVCVLGLNQNRGQKILLRLRTDDLQGFRKFLGTKKVLYHELAHMVYDDHDDNFYQLMRQIEREATELDWTQSKGKTLSGFREVYRGPDGEGVSYEYEPAFEGGAHTLGGDSTFKDLGLSARDLAASAAQLRLSAEEKQIEEMCGCSHKHRKHHKPDISEAKPTKTEDTQTGVPPPEASSVIASPATLRNVPTANDSSSCAEDIKTEDEPKEAPSSTATEVPDTVDFEQNRRNISNQRFSSEIHELISMGFTKEKALEALTRHSGSLPLALEWLLGDTNSDRQETPTQGQIDMSRRPREERLQHYASQIGSEAGPQKTLSVMDMLISILQNIMDNPEEEKYRVIKKSNNKFQRTIGSLPSAIQFLVAAGFEDEGELYRHKRNDVGLLWLGKDIVEQQKSSYSKL